MLPRKCGRVLGSLGLALLQLCQAQVFWQQTQYPKAAGTEVICSFGYEILRLYFNLNKI